MIASATLPPADLIEWQIGHLLRRAYGVARKNTATALATLGDVSPVQAAAVAALAAGPLTQAELGRRIDMEPSNTHTLVRRLDALALTVTTRGTGNLRQVSLTDGGQALAGRLGEALAAAAAVTLAPLSQAEQTEAIALLRRIVGIAP